MRSGNSNDFTISHDVRKSHIDNFIQKQYWNTVEPVHNGPGSSGHSVLSGQFS